MSVDSGYVYLVGAGPGDPSLITVRGMELLQQADVIVYDRLVHPDLLCQARENATLVYVGKRPGSHTLLQEEINRIIVKHAAAGKQVVRLKGGDPGIFARVGEEAAYCAAHAIPYEIVPGVSAGLAAPLYAGIPLTHREKAASVAIVTGHLCGRGSTVDWGELAKQVDTLVIYMGVSNLSQIRRELLHNGHSPDTPVALIRWGTWMGRQETVCGTLEDIESKVEARKLGPPAIIVIGDVVAYRKQLAWFTGERNDTVNREHELERV